MGTKELRVRKQFPIAVTRACEPGLGHTACPDNKRQVDMSGVWGIRRGPTGGLGARLRADSPVGTGPR